MSSWAKLGPPFSAYIVQAKPGQGPPLHRHPSVEVAFTPHIRSSSFQRAPEFSFFLLNSYSLPSSSMSFISLEQLPFVGMSHEFVGETHGAPFSAYIVNAKPGKGPLLHTHPYVEVAFTLEGCATITVGDEEREVKAGGIVVIPAETPHRFVNSGDTVLRQIDVHASPTFIQTNL
jgi:quercetin dioxygenase-like cupin family protein